MPGVARLCREVARQQAVVDALQELVRGGDGGLVFEERAVVQVDDAVVQIEIARARLLAASDDVRELRLITSGINASEKTGQGLESINSYLKSRVMFDSPSLLRWTL